MVVQWLGLCASTAEVQPLVGELRSHKPVRDGKKKKKKNARGNKQCLFRAQP